MDHNILTIATGSRKYVEMAYNLTLTLRASSPRCKVAVITDQRLEPIERETFDLIIQPRHLHPHQIKANMYSYLPKKEGKKEAWKHAFFIDADTVFNHHRHDLEDEFAKMVNEEIAFARPTKIGEMPWATIAETKEFYKIDDLPLITSAAFYFKRGTTAKKFFAKAGSLWGKFKNITADEIYFNAALALTKTNAGFISLYFPQRVQDAHGELYRAPWFSLGWKTTPQQAHIFNVVAEKAANILATRTVYKIVK